MSNRKSIPRNTETELLVRSARRCCLCFGLQGDFEQKQGQITHLDKDPSNNIFGNLAWLCLPHHEEYDTKTSQSKGLTVKEVKRYRDELYTRVEKSLKDNFPQTNKTLEPFDVRDIETDIYEILSTIQSQELPLSQSIARSFEIARKTGNDRLESFCRNELAGYSEDANQIPAYRRVDVFLSPLGKINPKYLGLRRDTSHVIDYMESNPDMFIPYSVKIAYSISNIEVLQKHISDGSNEGILSLSLPMGAIIPNANKPDARVPTYLDPKYIQSILDSIRTTLTNLLLELIP